MNNSSVNQQIVKEYQDLIKDMKQVIKDYQDRIKDMKEDIKDYKIESKK